MEENYILSVCGTQYTGEEPDKIELQTRAVYVIKNGTRYISYKEYNEQKPDQPFRTTVKIDENNVVTVIKGGDTYHNLILEKGVRHHCDYKTPYGTLFLGVFTEDVRIRLGETGGTLEVAYNLDVDSELISKNKLSLKLEEAH